MNTTSILEGRISAAAALASPYRTVQRILVAEGKSDRSLRWLEHRAAEQDVPVVRMREREIAALAQGTSHGGILAEVGPRRTLSLAELVEQAPLPFIVMLDGIEDPYNFGHALRAIYAAGAHGLVLRPRNWLSAAATVARSSAGASELMPIAVAETALDAAAFFRERGLAVACAAEKEAVAIEEADLTQPLFLLVGGEKRGVTRSFKDQADLRVRIPYGRDFRHSLGSTAAAAILAYEVMRQRRARDRNQP